ncbi:LacI family transcriptional regulator [Carnobacterium divergens]|uniref:LacI family DNA-binding transcriptional regulator n=1 Tax=Carnobacterium divergens TaxID=2748 RepID=UPI001072A597|nr:LacI family DNA-binding transcriptional regulator [Carnobacterium divergens]MDT1997329.1 LacI family transcriptional regulator [Carnobacterium divergens]TFI66058.1 LacI family transcriptional regulator [Carnobacterium divergens]TFI66117.1 LacI family transcriptional regulator [Carnobacterium divergens]TFI69764.1 LacI family transcriptional regulator [Carnobacterium divergens]TFI80879.1 LacI family transcriptional regulator [Carnobacterium divergens]
MKMTIKDVARLAGVSITTVSQILNKKGDRFSPETRQKVLAVVKELDYKADYFAQNMVSKQTKTIGMVVPDITDLFFSKVIEGVEKHLNELGFMIILCNSNHSSEKENLYIEELLHRSVEGIILASPNPIHLPKLKNEDGSNKIPHILIDRGINKRDEGQLITNEFQGAYEAVEHLVNLGHREIGMLSNETSFYEITDRFYGYKKCLADYQIPFQEEWIVSKNLTIKGGYEGAQQLLQQNITALFCGNDQMAIGAYRAINEAGKQIPKDISVIGYDGLEITDYLVPSLTTVAQPIFEIGYFAAKFLIDHINNPKEKVPNKYFDTQLVLKNSTKKLDSF